MAATSFPGHLGHLTQAQEKAFAEFREACAEKGLYTFEDPAQGKLASHDDIEMIRFLRARRFVVADALKQFSDTQKWRADEKIDDLYEHFDVDEYERVRKLYPEWTGRRDRDGMPLYVYRVADLLGPNLNEYAGLPAKAKTQRLATLYENMSNFVIPLCNAAHKVNPKTDKPALESISSMTIITDIGNVSLWTFWNLKGHMQDSSRIAQDKYPETLHRQFIINAPSFFPTVWGWIKKWFDPVTTSKITILAGSLSKEELGQKLAEFVDKSDLPKRFGGEFDWDYGMAPKVDEGVEAVLGKEWVESDGGMVGPMRWVRDAGVEGVQGRAVKLGSVGGKDRGVSEEA
ncbi:CRAL-TRIO domain-containing protein [Kalaharituber pfeilii]|nr:CRAL-TRIO domain-containing protein [Kalaharituber pfeilii]